MKLTSTHICLSDRVKPSNMQDDGEMKIYLDEDVLTGSSTPFTKFAWFLISRRLYGISKGGQVASSLIKAVSLKRRLENNMVDSVANQEEQQQTITVSSTEHGCQPEKDVADLMTQATNRTIMCMAEMREDSQYSGGSCDRGCGETDEDACRHCGITFCGQCQRQGFRYLFDCMCGRRLVASPAAHHGWSSWQLVGIVGVAGSPLDDTKE